jgi:NodT family efflux transporter outer membrane factor (OMF) lipoprotein
MTRIRSLICASVLSLLTACAVGPNYQRPTVTMSANFKEVGDWKPSEPNDAMTRGPWWEIFQDEVLNQLESQIEVSNLNVKAALASYEQSVALLREARAGYWPTISVNGQRSRTVSGSSAASNASLGGFGGTGSVSGFGLTPGVPVTRNTLGATGDWTVDVWGQVRRAAESSKASAQASAATLENARLSAQAQLATAYFELRAQDQLQTILNDIVAAEEASLKIAENRYRVGVAAKADVVTAQTQLLSSQSSQVNAQIQRATLEHSIAVLVGQEPASFSQPPVPIRTDVPTVPAGVPSELLQRRPDIAEAERKAAAANAQIGVAETAFFPSLTLTGSDNYTSGTISRLIRTANRVWAFGPQVALTLFDGGSRRAKVAAARAEYDLSVDNYRQAVLTAFQNVEDELVTLRILEKQAAIEEEAVKAAREAEALTLNQYKAGTVPYSSVISAQTARLNAEQTALNVLRTRLTSSVALIQDLGGGWDASKLPKP